MEGSVDVHKYRYLVLQAPINITFEQSSFFGIFIQGVCVWKESTYENDKYYAILKPVFLCFLGYIFLHAQKPYKYSNIVRPNQIMWQKIITNYKKQECNVMLI